MHIVLTPLFYMLVKLGWSSINHISVASVLVERPVCAKTPLLACVGMSVANKIPMP